MKFSVSTASMSKTSLDQHLQKAPTGSRDLIVVNVMRGPAGLVDSQDLPKLKIM
jgi:hypothetical protein